MVAAPVTVVLVNITIPMPIALEAWTPSHPILRKQELGFVAGPSAPAGTPRPVGCCLPGPDFSPGEGGMCSGRRQQLGGKEACGSRAQGGGTPSRRLDHLGCSLSPRWGLVLPCSPAGKHQGPSVWEVVILWPHPRFMLPSETLLPNMGKEMVAKGESGIL